MRKRKLLIVAGACLVTLSLTVGSAMADPTGPVPPPYRELAGVGAETTQGVFNFLSDIIKIDGTNKTIASYDNAPPGNIQTKADPNCTIVRPSQGGAGTDALVHSIQANDGCVDFARVVTNDAATRPPGLTYIPFAVDALTYAVRDDSSVPRNLTIAQLTQIYNCQNPNFEPLLGVFGAGNRTFFLKKLNITDAADLVSQPGHTCIKDTDSTGAPLLANDGRLLTNPRQLVTYSSAPYLAQVNNVVPDKHGTALLAAINSISPAVPNTTTPDVTYAITGDSAVPRALTTAQLKSIYNCTNTAFQPLLPAVGDPVRNAFLARLGISPGPCVVDTGGAGNDGRVLNNPQQLVPYSTQTYLNQLNNVVPDIHSTTILGSIDATSPTVLNNASVMSRDVYNVVPTNRIGAGTTTNKVFVGTGSAVCSNTATIVRNGFNLEPGPAGLPCGDTTTHS